MWLLRERVRGRNCCKRQLYSESRSRQDMNNASVTNIQNTKTSNKISTSSSQKPQKSRKIIGRTFRRCSMQNMTNCSNYWSIRTWKWPNCGNRQNWSLLHQRRKEITLNKRHSWSNGNWKNRLPLSSKRSNCLKLKSLPSINQTCSQWRPSISWDTNMPFRPILDYRGRTPNCVKCCSNQTCSVTRWSSVTIWQFHSWTPRCWRCGWGCTRSRQTSGKRCKTRKVWCWWLADPSSRRLRSNLIIISSFRRKLENWDSWLTSWLVKIKMLKRLSRRRYFLPIINWRDWPVRLSVSPRRRRNWSNLLTISEKKRIGKSLDLRICSMMHKNLSWAWVKNRSWLRSWSRSGIKSWKRSASWRTDWLPYSRAWNRWRQKWREPPCRRALITNREKDSIIR